MYISKLFFIIFNTLHFRKKRNRNVKNIHYKDENIFGFCFSDHMLVKNESKRNMMNKIYYSGKKNTYSTYKYLKVVVCKFLPFTSFEEKRHKFS